MLFAPQPGSSALADSAYDPPPETGTPPTAPQRDDVWDDNAAEVIAWVRSGGFPAAGREDLLRDVISLWKAFPPEHSAWNTTASLLGTLAAMRDAPGSETPAFRALSELSQRIEECASGIAGAEQRAVEAVRHVAALVSPAAQNFSPR